MPDDAARPWWHGPFAALRQAVRRTDDFVLVLVLLITSYVLFAASGQGLVRAVVIVLYALTFVIAFRATGPSRRQQVALAVTCVAAVVVVGLAYLLLPEADADGIANVFVTAMLLVTLVSTLSRVLRHRRVTLQTIAGALSAYLLVGMMFSTVFAVVSWLGPHPFFAGGGNEDLRSFQYFSFSTLTTTGYGDLAPLSPAGRALANMESLAGQIFLATLVARLVASYRMLPRRDPDDDSTGDATPTRGDGSGAGQ
ncbi:hypothetical protein GCM10023221_22410 [Luteimicrobium xylanilyticum]|uniref:Potassium channel domain-containing protein n=1 Tax=Luteimicrobium xylanilyticum TaxID=1133546 RepID=A0A5P9Q600_9MICO|nr:potassium channel family protein [Luteimicrobium xylanilyticum]QFU96827.1 hypothetical protein KDY119_00317 [Luteimicrobium xylanilyticum]